MVKKRLAGTVSFQLICVLSYYCFIFRIHSFTNWSTDSAWRPAATDTQPFLLFTFSENHILTAIQIQGNAFWGFFILPCAYFHFCLFTRILKLLKVFEISFHVYDQTELLLHSISCGKKIRLDFV